MPGNAATTREACEKSAARLAHPNAAAAAFCKERPISTLDFQEVATGIFVHRGAIAEASSDNLGDVSNIAFVIGTNAVAVIDAGGSRAVGEQVYAAIRERTELPISTLIMTHMHPDHVLGAAPLKEAGADVIGHKDLTRALLDRSESYLSGFANLIGNPGFLGTEITLPDREIDAASEIHLGDRTLTLTPHPTAHTATDLTVVDGATGTLFAGDLVFQDHAPALDGSLRGWQAVLGQMKQSGATAVVPGHGGPILAWPDGAEDIARYLEVLAADTRAAIADGVPLSRASSMIALSEAPHWQLFELFNARNATAAYTELEWE